MTRSQFEQGLFVMIWQAAETLDEAARALGVGPERAKNHAAWLRSRGVNLRVLRRRMRGPERWDQSDSERNAWTR